MPDQNGALTVRVTAPNGGEMLNVGQQVNITWQSSGAAAHAVKLSTDGGQTFNDIATELPGSAQSYSWIVPSLSTNQGRIRIAARDTLGNRITDDSDGLLSIQTAQAPVVTSVSPTSGPTVGGTTITILGANFRNGCTVKVGGGDALNVTFVDGGRVLATTPAGPAGSANVRVVNPDGQGGGLPGAFTYTQIIVPAPIVTSVSPASGPTTGGTQITINGANFRSGCTVKVGGSDALNPFFVDGTRVMATTPPGAVGAVNIRVVNPDGQGGGLSSSFTYTQVIVPAPALFSINPISGPTSGGTQITIDGANFKNGCTVKVGGSDATNVVFINDARVLATTPAGPAGAANVRVVNPDGQGGGLTSAFTYTQVIVPAPVVTGVNPSSGPSTGGTQITVNGQNFKSGCMVKIGGNDATNVQFIDGGRVLATTPAGPVGAANVRVVNPDGQGGNLTGAFTYTQVVVPAPVVTSVSPASGPTTGGTQITVNGQNFKSGCSVKVGGNDATNVQFIDGGRVLATTPAGPVGAANVRVVNPDGQGGGLTGAFTYTQVIVPAPAVFSVSPTSGPTSGGTQIIIDGANFKSGCTVKVGGGDATNVVFVSDTRVTATTPAGPVGAANVRVVNPDGQGGGLTSAFTYTQVIVPAPVVTGVNPSSGPSNGGTQITVNGQNFKSGCTVKVGGNDTTNVQFIDATRVTAITPAGPVGAANVRVVNPDGQGGGLPGAFTYTQIAPAVPVVSSVSPVSGPASGGTTIVINGQNFINGCSVKVGGNDATNVQFIDGGRVTATTPPGAVGAANVRVVNPDGTGGGLPGAFTYIAAPALSVQVTAPNGGERFVTGSSVNIQWQSTGAVSQRVEYAVDGAADYQTIASGLAGTVQSCVWAIPVSIIPAGKTMVSVAIRVVVRDAAGAETSDVSDKPIAVSRPAAQFVSPPLANVPSRDAVLAAGQPTSFPEAFIAGFGNVVFCVKVTPDLIAPFPATLTPSVTPAVERSSICGAGFVELCGLVASDPNCNKFTVNIASDITTPAGTYFFGLRDDWGNALVSADGNFVLYNIRIRSARVRVVPVSGPATIDAGNTVTYEFDIKRSGYLGAIELTPQVPVGIDPNDVMLNRKILPPVTDPDLIERVTMTVRTIRPQGGVTQGTPRGPYTITLIPTAAPGVAAELISGSVSFTVQIIPDVDVTITPLMDRTEQGKTIPFVVRLFVYDNPVLLDRIVTLPPGAKGDLMQQGEPEPLSSGNGTRTTFLLEVMPTTSTPLRDEPYDVSFAMKFNNRRGTEKTPTATAKLKVLPGSDRSIAISSPTTAMDVRQLRCATFKVDLSTTNLDPTDIVEILVDPLPKGFTATVSPTTLELAKESRTVDVIVNADETTEINNSILFKVRARSTKDKAIVSDPLSLALTVIGRPQVKVLPPMTSKDIGPSNQRFVLFTFDRGKGPSCTNLFRGDVELKNVSGIPPGFTRADLVPFTPGSTVNDALVVETNANVEPGPYIFFIEGTADGADVVGSMVTINVTTESVIIQSPKPTDIFRGFQTINIAWKTRGTVVTHDVTVHIDGVKVDQTFVGLGANVQSLMVKLGNAVNETAEAFVEVTSRDRTGGVLASDRETFTVRRTERPTIASFDPISAPVGAPIAVTGTNFVAGETQFFFSDGRPTTPTVRATPTITSDTMLTVTVPKGAGRGPLRVANPSLGMNNDGLSSNLFDVITTPSPDPTVDPLQITSIAPVRGIQGSTVQIAGTGFDRVRGVAFNGAPAQFTVVSATAITTVVPIGATTGPISVTTSTGTVTSAVFFQIVTIIRPPLGGLTGGRLTGGGTPGGLTGLTEDPGAF